MDDGRVERRWMMEGWRGVGGWKDGEGLEDGRVERVWRMEGWRGVGGWKDAEGLDDGRKREGSDLLN